MDAANPTIPSGDAGDPSFMWQHEHKLDAQKRVSFPAEWRSADPNLSFILVLWPHPNSGRKFGFIKGLPEKRYRKVQAKLDQAAFGDPGAAALKRQLVGNAMPVKVDPAGRLSIPPRMADQAGLKKEVIFLGAGGEFEIWDPQLLDQCTQGEAGLASQAYGMI